MGIIEAGKKGIETATRSLLLCLVVMVILFVGYIIIGSLLGITMLSTKFPPIAPDMTPEQINALNWGQVNWGIFVPAVVVIFLLGFLLNAFTQSGIIGVLKDYMAGTKESVKKFFGYAAKFSLKILLQIILVVIVTAAAVVIALLAMTLIALINIQPVIIALSVVIFVALMAILIYVAMTLVYGQIGLVYNNSKPVQALGDSVKFINKNFVKTVSLFIVTGIIYLAFYFIIRQLSAATMGWNVGLQIVWNLVTSYIYLLVSIFMLGSFIAFYQGTK